MIASFLKAILLFLLKVFFNIFFRIKGKPTFTKNLKEAILLYEKDGFCGLFAKIRAWDAPYEEIEKLIPSQASVLDLGCGDGLMANYLALASLRRRVFGIELNRKRIVVANKGLKNTKFKAGDILKSKFPKVDIILLIHVLHHLASREDQEKLLDKIARTLKKGEKLIILEISKKPIFKYLFSFITDAITVPLLFENKIFTTKFFYREPEEWRKLLRERSFSVKSKPIHKGMPFSHALILATKK